MAGDGKGRKMIFAVVAAAVFLLDFFVKKQIENNMASLEGKKICKGRILLCRHHNYGAIFNRMEERPGLVKKFCGGFWLALGIAWFLLLRKKDNIGLKLGLSLILGAGGSNLYDRIARGYVVDYFSFRTPWERLNRVVFNISDFFIFLGSILAAFSGK